MLRRVQPVASVAETESAANDPGPKPAAPPFVERRQSDRRGIDALRAEALQNLISRVEDKNFGGLRNQVQWSPKLKPSRLMLLVVAVIAGGLAAYLAVQRTPAAPVAEPEAVVEVVPEPRTQVLVAKEPIAIGQRLTAASVGWAEWPESALVPEYMDIVTSPEAVADVEGAVARTDFVPGEPIREARLAPDGQGFLSTVIASGKRAVSVVVSAATASGGFITPSDRVDVVLTRTSDRGQFSETILTNVRILAIDHRTSQQQGAVSDAPPDEPEVFGGNATATLELGPVESEVVINASTVGRLSLVLRPAADADQPEAAPLSANQAIRMSSPFWTN